MKNDYILIYARRKTVGIRIAVDGSVVVRAPRGTSKNDIDAVVERHQGWIEKHRKTVLKKETLYSEADDSALEIKAREIILPLVRHYSALMGVTPSSVRFTGAKKRFGSCSSRKTICFSRYLALYPLPAIEYVVVHELAHLTEMNHSARFYAFVESQLPDWRERKQLLK